MRDDYNRLVPARCDFYMEIYNWDGQTHCPRTDCIALTHPFNTSYAVKCYVFAPVLTVVIARARHTAKIGAKSLNVSEKKLFQSSRTYAVN